MTQDAASAVACLREAAELNRSDPFLRGSVVTLPDYGQVVMTGDLHGHRRNFDKLQQYCRLAQTPIRHVVLHELIHGEADGPGRADMSHALLLAAAAWKIDYPDQVHLVQSNHELAQLNRHEIAKNGRSVLSAFDEGVGLAFGAQAGDVLSAIDEFVRLLPLAVRTPNRALLAHSLPVTDAFDVELLSKSLDEQDLSDGGPVHQMVWGRPKSDEQFSWLAEMFDVDWFVLGHQPQEQGYAVLGARAIILASEHNHGTFLPFDLRKPYTLDDLTALIRKFVAVA